MSQWEAVAATHWSQWLRDSRQTVVLVDHDGEAADCRRRIAAAVDGAYLENVRVIPKAQWWVELWDASFPARQVLRPVQLLVLAEKCLSGSEFLGQSVIGLQGIAQRFVDAFELAERYGIAELDSAFATEEQQAFRHWREALRGRLQEQGVLSAGQLLSALQQGLDALELPARIVLSEQLELGPGERDLLSAMARRGVERYSLPPFRLTQAPDIKQACFSDIAGEVSACAQWVVWQLEGKTLAQSRATQTAPRIGVVAADMRVYEQFLRRALERQLYPSALFPASAGANLSEPWRVGTGRLSGYPVVAIALDALLVGAGEVSLEQLSRLLRSDFIADAGSLAGPRAQVDWHWREHLQSRSSLNRALREARFAGLEAAVEPFQALAERAAEHGGRAAPSIWVQRFDAELLSLGWPNREAGDAVVDQCRQGFSQVMDTLRALDRQLGQINRGEALRWLQHVLQGKRFELRRDETPSIHLLSLEEARGQQFDALWLLGLSDTALPVAVEPSPFLSREHLLKAGVPRADHADALRRDRALLEELLAAAGECVLSRPRHNAEAVPQSACTLIDWQWPELELPAIGPAFSLSARLGVPEGDPVRGVSSAEKQRLRGGTGIFKAYALSPFYAFLKYRLGLQPLPEPVEGLDPRTQGDWIHRALEFFWRELQTSEALQALSNAELESRIENCVERAMSDAVEHGDELRRVEKRRIQSLLQEWLSFERGRNEPFTVEATEAAGRVDAYGIPLRIKVDRIDRIGDRYVVIDYKSGTVAANSLNADNLLEPQLPLYALLGQSIVKAEVEGVVLAQIHARGGMKVHMRSSWASNLVDKRVQNPVDSPEKWQAECEAWQKVLQNYALGFLAGDTGHDHTLGATAFPYDPFVPALARAGETADDD